jgi:hypothetical protein
MDSRDTAWKVPQIRTISAGVSVFGSERVDMDLVTTARYGKGNAKASLLSLFKALLLALLQSLRSLSLSFSRTSYQLVPGPQSRVLLSSKG